jgi:MmgE/PrpD N-terminal domain
MKRRDFITLLGGAAAGLSPAWLSPVACAQTAASKIDARSGSRGPTVAEDIARWVVELRYEQLPPDVIARAKRVLLDTLGCALGAIGAEPVRMAQRVVALQGGNPQATILGIGQKASCDQAAFLNGMAAVWNTFWRIALRYYCSSRATRHTAWHPIAVHAKIEHKVTIRYRTITC